MGCNADGCDVLAGEANMPLSMHRTFLYFLNVEGKVSSPPALPAFPVEDLPLRRTACDSFPVTEIII